MTLELIEASESGEVVEGGLPAVRIVADNDEAQWLEIYPVEGGLRIPLDEICKAIELAKEGVHGEEFYDLE